MSNSGLNYVGQLFDNDGEIKDYKSSKLEFNLEDKFYFSWMQLIDSIPLFWKINIMDLKGNSIDLCIFDCHVIKKSQNYVINRLNRLNHMQCKIIVVTLNWK